jgi:hypothetical protein
MLQAGAITFGRRGCVAVCDGPLALTERKCHKGECALQRKTAKQKARRASRSAREREGATSSRGATRNKNYSRHYG